MGAARLPAGRGIPHYLRACAGGVDVAFCVFRDGGDGFLRAGLEFQNVRGACLRFGARRRFFHFYRARHRRNLGKADVGDLVGLGRAPDFRTCFAFFVFGFFRAAGGDTGKARRLAGGGYSVARRFCKCPGDSFFRGLVEHTASAGDGSQNRRSFHSPANALSAACDGGRVYVFVRGMRRAFGAGGTVKARDGFAVNSFSAFLQMGGYGAYVWSAYAVTALVLAANVFFAWRGKREGLRAAKKRREEKQ